MDNKMFSLWIEHEEYGEMDDYFNIQISIKTSEKTYALNVWTLDFLNSLLHQVDDSGYLDMPDIVVKSPQRKYLEEVISKMIKNDQLKDEWEVKSDERMR